MLQFFRRIQMVHENQTPTKYNFCDNKTDIKQSNKDEAYKCMSKAKKAYRLGNFEIAVRLSK